MTRLERAREFLVQGKTLAEAAKAIGVLSSVLDACLWQAISHHEHDELRATRWLDIAAEEW